jgi:hypothetical protein
MMCPQGITALARVKRVLSITPALSDRLAMANVLWIGCDGSWRRGHSGDLVDMLDTIGIETNHLPIVAN